MRKIKLYGVLLAALLAIIVIGQNTAVVETKVLFMTIAMPRAALLAITLGTGILIGLGIAFVFRAKKDSSHSD